MTLEQRKTVEIMILKRALGDTLEALKTIDTPTLKQEKAIQSAMHSLGLTQYTRKY